MQKSMRRRSAVAKPPRKTLVGVDGKGLSLGHSVEPMMTTFPKIKPFIAPFLQFLIKSIWLTRHLKAEQLSPKNSGESTKLSLIQIRVYYFSSLKFELPRLKNTYLLFLAVLCPRFFRESDILQEESTHFTRLRKIYVNIFVHHCAKLQRTSIKINSLNDITRHAFLSNNCHVDSSDKIGSRW